MWPALGVASTLSFTTNEAVNRKQFLTTLLAASGAGFSRASNTTGFSAQQQRLFHYCIHPEPRSMRSSISRIFSGELRTVFSPAKYRPETKRLESYTEKEFGKLGLGWDSFYQKAQENANLILATLTPQVVRATEAADAPVEALLFTGEEAWYSSLLIAPQLKEIARSWVGEHFIAAAPTQHSLYLLPAKTEILSKFTGDLLTAYENSPYAGSDELFSIKPDAEYPAVIGNFSGR